MARKQYDWEAIGSDYRTGQFSDRALASKHNIPYSTLRSHAKKEGWQKDLTKQVKQATKSKLLSKSLTESAQGETSETLCESDGAIVEQASDNAVSLILAHRQDIAQWRKISRKLAEFLVDVEIDKENHQAVSRSLNSGIDALGKAIKLERQAFNMDDDSDKEDDLSRLLDEIGSAAEELAVDE